MSAVKRVLSMRCWSAQLRDVLNIRNRDLHDEHSLRSDTSSITVYILIVIEISPAPYTYKVDVPIMSHLSK